MAVELFFNKMEYKVLWNDFVEVSQRSCSFLKIFRSMRIRVTLARNLRDPRHFTVPEKKIIFIFRRQILAETASQKQSRLTTYCRHRATIRCVLYVHTRAYAHVTWAYQTS